MEFVKNRYMFDTSALNHLVRLPEDFSVIYRSKFRGFEYLFTEPQILEAKNNLTTNAALGMDLLELMIKIQTKYVGPIATSVENSWLLDGTRDFLSENETDTIAMFFARFNDNQKRYNDALIAVTGIHNGCIIITNDKKFRRDVNKFFPERAITYENFIDCLKSSD